MSTMRYGWLFVLVAVGVMATVLPGAKAQPPACGFVPTGTIRGTDTFTPDSQSTVAVLQPGQVYAVVVLRGDRVNVAIDDAFGVWVDLATGTLRGNCAPLAAPAIVYTPQPELGLNPVNAASCVFVPAEAVIGSGAFNPATDAIIVNLTGEQAYAVVALTTQQVQITVDGVFNAWVPVAAGEVLGACDILLASTAVALNGARLWSVPDVTTGEVVATIPAQTALIVIDGPVNGPIRLDTDATGDWYFVQIGNTAQSGWLWQARLQFTN